MNKFYHSIILCSAFLISCDIAPTSHAEAANTEKITQAKTPSSSITSTISSGKLSGKFTNAGPDAPIILIVPGSGHTDLDGNSPNGIQTNSYKFLSEELAAHGISTLRVDKRGMFSSRKAGDPNAVTVDIYATDYKNWVETITQQTQAPCIYILGHSEGATMVSAAAIDNPKICGLILVAGPGRSLADIIREQLKANPANAFLLKDAEKALQSLEKGDKVDLSDIHPALHPLFATQVQDYLISLMDVDPVDLARKANTRTLILQGDRDLQISMSDAKALSQATNGQFVVLKGVNHILKKSSSKRSANFATYQNPDLPIAPAVIDAIVSFVLE